MPHFNCTVGNSDYIWVEDAIDYDGDIGFSIEENDKLSAISLSKEDARILAHHILKLLEESK